MQTTILRHPRLPVVPLLYPPRRAHHTPQSFFSRHTPLHRLHLSHVGGVWVGGGEGAFVWVWTGGDGVC